MAQAAIRQNALLSNPPDFFPDIWDNADCGSYYN
jgi:hypothetical protein